MFIKREPAHLVAICMVFSTVYPLRPLPSMWSSCLRFSRLQSTDSRNISTRSVSTTLSYSGYLAAARFTVQKQLADWPRPVTPGLDHLSDYFLEITQQKKHWLIGIYTILAIDHGNVHHARRRGSWRTPSLRSTLDMAAMHAPRTRSPRDCCHPTRMYQVGEIL